jgi:hypothetical protein
VKVPEEPCPAEAVLAAAAAAANSNSNDEAETGGGAAAAAESSPFDPAFDAIWEAHVQQLVPCPNCGRTFFPDRIGVHSKWCKGIKPK